MFFLFNPQERSWFGKVVGSKHSKTTRAIAAVKYLVKFFTTIMILIRRSPHHWGGEGRSEVGKKGLVISAGEVIKRFWNIARVHISSVMRSLRQKVRVLRDLGSSEPHWDDVIHITWMQVKYFRQ